MTSVQESHFLTAHEHVAVLTHLEQPTQLSIYHTAMCLGVSVATPEVKVAWIRATAARW